MTSNIKIKTFILLVFQLIYALMNSYFAFVTKELIDAISIGNTSIFVRYIYITIIVIVSLVILQVLLILLKNKIVSLTMTDLRGNILESILYQEKAHLESSESSKYFSYFTNELEILETNYVRKKLDLIGSIILLVISLIAIISFNIVFLPVIIVLLILLLVTPFLFSKWVKSATEENILKYELLINKTKEYMDLFYIIKMFNITSTINKKYKEVTKISMDSKCKLENRIGISNGLMSFLSILISISIYIVGGYLVLQGEITIGVLLAVIQLMANVTMPLSEILYGINQISSTKSIRKFTDNLLKVDKKTESLDENLLMPLELNSVSIEIDGKHIVNDINIKIEKNKNYVILGKNGSGKTTFAKLIAGLITDFKGNIISQGKILSRNNDIYKNVMFVSRDKQLFNSNTKDNLTLFGEYDIKNIDNIIDYFNLGSLLNSSTKSTLFSEGEKQKVIFARSLLKQKTIKIYDEPDSALDIESREKLFKVLLDNKETTNIVITHTIDSTLDLFDKIFYIKDGYVTEHNNYREVINN